MNPIDDKTFMAIGEWMRVLEAEGHNVGPGLFWICASKSQRKGLLGRLLAGKPALPAPPPTSFSAPWYEIVEAGPEGLTGGMDVSDWGDHGEAGALVINQCRWAIIERRPGREYLIEFRGRDLIKPTRLPQFLCTFVRPGDMFDVWHLRAVPA